MATALNITVLLRVLFCFAKIANLFKPYFLFCILYRALVYRVKYKLENNSSHDLFLLLLQR